MLLKKDTTIRLSPAGRQRWENEYCNPHTLHGTIIRVRQDNCSFTYQVLWSNHYTNSYGKIDLEVV